MTPKIQAAEQFLQSLPNPTKIKELYFNVKWATPTGHNGYTGVLVVTALVVAIVVVAVCITVYNVRTARR